LVQHTEVGLRAFVNECPHRLSAIQTTAMGKRPLVCPYHAWSFDSEGKLRGIPNLHLYGFSPEEHSRICLKKLSLETIGPLIFINLDDEPMPLSDQFSRDFLEELSSASAHVDLDVIYSCVRVNYNWKLAMENVKDHNHVPFVHSKSFSPAVKALDHHAAWQESNYLASVCSASHPLLEELSYGARHSMTPGRTWFAQHCHVYSDTKSYCNWFVYPNVNFCCIKGSQFLLQQYEPVSPGQTDCHVWIMTAKRHENAPDFTALLATLMRAELAVMAEDTAILEKMQSNLGVHSGHFLHGNYETALIKHHVWYRSFVLDNEH